MTNINDINKQYEFVVPYNKLGDYINEHNISLYNGFGFLLNLIRSYEIKKIICLAVGDLCRNDKSRCQISLIFGIKQKIPDVEIYFCDPKTCENCCKFLTENYVKIIENKDGFYTAEERTLFFVPYGILFLYHNILSANWCKERISNVFIYGNSFSIYSKDKTDVGRLYHVEKIFAEETPEFDDEVSLANLTLLYFNNSVFNINKFTLIKQDSYDEDYYMKKYL